MAKLIQGGGDQTPRSSGSKLVVDPNNLVFSPVPGQTLESVDLTPQAGELSRLGVNLMTDYNYETVNQKLALEQGTGEQAMNMIKGGSKQFLAGFLDNFNYDIPDMVDLVKGKEQEYGNWLSEFTEELRESAEENPIYQDGDSFSDPAYWMNQGKNLAFSVGLATGALTEQAALTALTGSTFGAGGALQGTRFAAQMAKLSRATKGVAGNVLFGTMKGVHEGYINALETYKGTFDKFIDLGFTEAEATKRAGQAAALGYKLEVAPLMALNGLQFGTLGKYNPFKGKSMNLGYSGAVENVTSKIFPGVKNKFVKGALDLGVNAGSESLEEMIQTGVSKYAQYETVADAGYAFADLEIFDQEMTDSMVGGFLGGLVFGTMGKVVDRYRSSSDKSEYGRKHDEFIAKVKQKSMEDLKLFAEASGNERKMDFLRYKMAKQGAVNAIFIDMANQKETAFESYVGGMQDILDAAKSGKAEELKAYGIETKEDLQHIIEKYPQFIEDAEQFKTSFVAAHQKTGDVYASLNLADANAARIYASEAIRRDTLAVSNLFNGDPVFENSSADTKKYIHLLAQQRAMVMKKLQDNEFTSMDAAGVGYSETFKEENQKIEDEKAKLELSDKDKALAETYDIDKAVGLLFSNLEMESVIDKANDKIKYWSKSANVRKETKKRAENRINNAKTEKDVVQAEADLKKQGDIDQFTQEKINSKKQEARVKEKVGVKDSGVAPNPKTKTQAQKITNIVKEANADVVEQDSLEDDFLPMSTEGFNADQKAAFSRELKNYYNNMKSDISNPTFEDLILDFIKNEGRDTTEKMFNILDEAWKANKYPTAKANTIYKKYFQDRKIISSRMVELAEVEDESTVVQENKEVMKQAKKAKAPVVTLDKNNQPTLTDGTSFKTSTPTLKFAHLSIPYARTIQEQADGSKIVVDEDISNELNESQKINSIKLLHPDLFNPGSQIQIRIPDNAESYYVTYWEDSITKGESMTFGEWMKKTGVEKGSGAWLEKVPMVISDGKDDVAYLHDVEWYNPINVGLKDKPEDQAEVIQEARTNLMNVRESVITDGSITMEITEKRPGTFQTFDEPVSLEQANPQAQIAIAGEDGRLYLNGDINTPMNTDDLLFTDQKFVPGYVYDIRRGTVKGEHTAFRVSKGLISNDTKNTVKWLLRSYLLSKDAENKYEASIKARSVAKQVMDATGLDPKDVKDLGELLSAHIRLINLSGVTNITNPASIQEYITRSPKLKDGEPYMAMEKGRVIIGIKGGEVSYLHSESINDASKAKAIPTFFNVLTKVMNAGFRNNVSKNFLTDKRKMPVFDTKGQMTSTKEYETHVRQGLETTVKSFNVGTEEAPVFATVVQPVINFAPSSNDFGNFVETGKVSQSSVEMIANKIMSGKSLTKQEEAMRQTAVVEVEEILQKEAVQSIPVNEETNPELSIDEIKTLQDTKEFLLSTGLSITSSEIKAINDQLGITNDDLQPAPLSEEQVMQMREDLSGVEGISILQDYLITDYLFNEISATVSSEKYRGKINEGELMGEFRGAYETLIAPKRTHTEQVLSNLKKINIDGLKGVIERMELEMEVFQVIADNWESFAQKAMDKYQKYDFLEEVDNNYSRESFEKNKQASVSTLMKKFLRNVKQVDANGQVATGFLGIPLYVSFDTVDSTVRSVLATPNETAVDFDTMILRLEENRKNQRWLPQIIERLKAAPDQVKNQFVYNYQGHSLSMKFLMYSQNRNGGHTLKIYDTNSNEVTRNIRQSWNTNLKGDAGENIFAIRDGNYIVNKDRAKVLVDEFNQFSEQLEAGTPVENETLKTWLRNFGIQISDETLNEIKDSPMEIVTKETKKKIPFNQLFRKSKNSSGLFGKLAAYAEEVANSSETLEVEENDKNHPYSDMSGILNTLSRIESKYAKYATVHSFRDGDKNIFAYTNSKHGTDVVNKLRFDEAFRTTLGEKDFNKESLLLKMLNESAAVREKFSVDHVGITSNKEMGSKPFGDNSITKASPTDHEHVKIGMFQDTKQGEVKYFVDENKSIETRMARMFLPTMSDKSQMLDILLPVLNLQEKNFNEDKTISDAVLNVAYSQLVTPEVNRIANSKATNIKGYDTGAGLFLMIPAMNSLKYEGERVIQLMAQDPERFTADWFQKNMGQEARDLLKTFLETAVKAKIQEWKEIGVVEGNENTVSKIVLLDSTYMDRFKSDMTKNVQMAATDYVINSYITNANIFMTMAGDPAIYAQGKMKSYFQNGDFFLPKEQYGENAYSIMAKDVLGVNIGKRLALMLTPGNKLANSKGQSYLQLFMEDLVDYTPNVLALAELFYENLNPLRNGLKLLKAQKDPARRAEMIRELQNTYPLISDYFEIEIADAQEYTTVKEHIDVLWGKGEIDDTTYREINAKLDRQYAAEEKGESIDPADYLSRRELSFVLQPMKPVYTGFIDDKQNNVMRMMYVKSSSFALIPQLTQGTELDNLRKVMEKVQKTQGKNVRASYQSANKVGALNKPVRVFNTDGTYNSELTSETASEATLIMDRENFRIQQEVPFKTGSKKEERNRLGTQPMKLLFGDGMLNLIDKEVYSQYNDAFNNILIGRRKALLNRLGVDANGEPINQEETANRLQKMLIEEATKRNYPRQDIEALKLEPVYDSNGEIIDISFSIPLWLSPNSNRYESLLNSVVTNQLVDLKMPGSSYVVGSEAGFQMKAELEGIQVNNIVYTNKWKGSLRPAEIRKNKLKKAQVLVAPKFRDAQGNVIKLINEDGTPNPYYTERDDNGILRLKEDMIAEELLSMSSYRIPTSGHVSMSQVEIVGFLPEEAGDLMIMPMNFITQMGQDFDIDKQYSLQKNSYMDKDGKLKVYDEESLEADLEDLSTIVAQNKAVDALLGIFGDTLSEDYTDGTISAEERLEKMRNKLMEKIYENQIVDAFEKVLSDPNPEVQKKIQKVLSMDFAKSQAEIISDQLSKEVGDNMFSFLSDTYQKDKMELGSSGKTGIGVYSNYVTFHSLSNQAQSVKQPRLQVKGENGLENYSLTIGNYIASGVLGNENTLDGNRSVAEVFAERQNTATDNEKEQIMGRVNVNDYTINVDSLLTALGFDQDTVDINGQKVQMSIPYLLLSQPIVRDYVRLMKIKSSNVAGYNPNLKEEAIAEAKKKYGEADPAERNLLTGQALYDSLSDPSDAVQLSVLEIFNELENMARKVQAFQTMLSINRSGLGKSFFETIEKHDQLGDLTVSKAGVVRHKAFPEVMNVDAYIGDIKKVNSDTEITDAIEDGYSIAKNVAIKPTTPVGRMITEAVITGYNLWSGYFPYDEAAIRVATDRIIKMTTNDQTSDRKKTEIKMEVFKEMKKYFASSTKLGAFQDNPKVERYRLYFDNETEDKTSLANYLRQLKDTPEYRDLVANNKLMSRFQFEINKDGHPSLIKFDNSRGENFDEEYMYTALIELVDLNQALPQFNGENYSTRRLAQDLVAYSYLEGGVQEAVQFTKYIPVSFLNAIGFGETVRKWASSGGQHFSAMLKNPENNLGRFTLQYFRNNPGRLPKVSENDITPTVRKDGKQGLSNILEFQLKEDPESPIVAMYNPRLPKGEHKFQIYMMGENGIFKKIPAAGMFGMSEYNIKESNPSSLIYGDTLIEAKPAASPEPRGISNSPDHFGISKGDLTATVANIAEGTFPNYPHLANLANALKGKIDPETKLLVDEEALYKGRFSSKDNAITLSGKLMNSDSAESVAVTVIHELIHSLTTDYVNSYVHPNGNYKVENVPASIQQLSLLFSEVTRVIGQEKLDQLAKNLETRKLTEEDMTVSYGGYNLKEMMTVALTEPRFQQEMNLVEYKSSGKTLLEKFFEIINDMMQTILGKQYRANSLTPNIIATTLQIVEEQAQSKGIVNSDLEAEALANDDVFKGKYTVVEQDNPFDVDDSETIDLSIFANPFKC